MSNFIIGQFIVIDSENSGKKGLRDLKRDSSGNFTYNMSGSKLYPFKTVIPVIFRSKGHFECNVVAIIERINMTENTTTVYFKGNEISKEIGKVYCDQYRTSISMGGGGQSDIFDASQDQVIPGIYRGKRKDVKEPKIGNSHSFFDDEDFD